MRSIKQLRTDLSTRRAQRELESRLKQVDKRIAVWVEKTPARVAATHRALATAFRAPSEWRDEGQIWSDFCACSFGKEN